MTNLQYLSKALSGLNLSEDDLHIILLKGNLLESDKADPNACDKAIYQRLSILLKSAMQNVSEGGFSLSWNLEAVKLYYTALCTELGEENVLQARPKVRNRSHLW